MPRILLLFLIAPLWVALWPAAARGQPQKDQARTLIRQAAQMMERREYAGAVALLKQAQQLYPDRTGDYNLGMAYAEWGKDPEAAAAFERFLGEAPGAAGVLPERVRDAQQRLEGYRAALARLQVEAPAPGASVYLDQQPALPLPLPAPLWVSAGAHQVRVTAAGGGRDYSVQISVRPGETRLVSARFGAADGAAALALVPVTQEPPTPVYKRWWFWAAVGGGAVLGATLIGVGAAGRFDRPAPGMDLPFVEVAR